MSVEDFISLTIKGVRALMVKIKKKNALVNACQNSNAIVVLEVGRQISQDVEKQLGEVTSVVSYIKTITTQDIPIIASEFYKAITEIHRQLSCSIKLVLSGPVALNFLIGQLIGINHIPIIIFHWNNGTYEQIPIVDYRELMK